jgi:threonine dehydratase
MRDVALYDHLVIEGAAGVAVAGYRRLMAEQHGHTASTSAIVLCGGQVSAETLTRVLQDTGSDAG